MATRANNDHKSPMPLNPGLSFIDFCNETPELNKKPDLFLKKYLQSSEIITIPLLASYHRLTFVKYVYKFFIQNNPVQNRDDATLELLKATEKAFNEIQCDVFLAEFENWRLLDEMLIAIKDKINSYSAD